MMKKHPPENDLNATNTRRFFALVTVLAVLVGQVILYTTPVREDVVMPASFWICIAGVVLFILSIAVRPPKFLQTIFGRLFISRVAVWVTIACVMSLLATLSMFLFAKANRMNYLPVITFWLFSAFCYLVAFLGGLPANLQWKKWLKEHRNELLWLGGIILLAILLRFYKLGILPFVINGDEGRTGLAAQSTNSGQLADPYALWENFGALYLQVMNLSLTLFGATPFALRLIPAIGGVLAVPAIYLFARQIAGKRVALIAAFLIACSHTHVQFSRTAAVGYIQSTWLVPLELYFLLSGLTKRSSWRTALAGILLAIHFSIYLTAQIVVALVLVYMIIAFLFFRQWLKAAGRQVAAFWGGLGIVILPEAVYAAWHPAEFFARLNMEGTFQSGWLAQTMAQTGHSAIYILAERVAHAFMSLIYYPAIDFYGSPIPMLTLVSAALFLVGLGISLWRTRSVEYLLLNGYFWALTVAIGVFAIPPTADSYRMLMTLPAAMLMAAIGLDYFLELMGIGWAKSRSGYVAVTSILLVSLLVTNVWTYFGDFAGRCLYGGASQDRFASYMGSYLGTVKREDTVYLLSNDVYFYGSHASVDFLSQRHTVKNFPEPVDEVDTAQAEIIIANPDRIDEMETWARAHPGGELRYFFDCKNLIMVAYQLP